VKANATLNNFYSRSSALKKVIDKHSYADKDYKNGSIEEYPG